MKKIFKTQTALQIIACTVIATFVVAAVASATTIGTNVSTGGTLEVTGASTLTGAVTTTAAATIGTDLTVTSGARVGTGSDGGHITALANDSLLVEGQSEFDGTAWFDGSLRASSTLMVTNAATLYSTLNVAGATTLDGNVTLGNATTDVITPTGYFTYARIGTGSDFEHISTVGADELGVEGQSEFDGTAWFDGSLRASSTLMVTNAATLYSTLNVAGATTLDGNVTLGNATTDVITPTGYFTYARIGTGSDFEHISTVGADELGVEGQSEFDGTAWFDGSLRASSTLMTTGAVTIGANALGADFTLYTDTAGEELLWDASENKLSLDGAEGTTALEITDGNVVITDNLTVNGTFTPAITNIAANFSIGAGSGASYTLTGDVSGTDTVMTFGDGGITVTTGTLTSANLLNANGGIAVDTNNFTIDGTTGALSLISSATTGNLSAITLDAAAVTGALTGLSIDLSPISGGDFAKTGLSITGVDAGTATSIGISMAGTVDYGIDLTSATINTADMRLENDDTISNATAKTIAFSGNLTVPAAFSLDTAAAGALNIGTSTATSIEIADTGVMTTIQGTLNVDEAVTLDTTLGVTGNLSVNTDKFVVTAATGNTAVGGNLTIPAAYSLDTAAAGALNIGTSTATSIEIADTGVMTTVQGTLNVDEAVTLDTTLGVTGAATFTAGAQSAAVARTATVAGDGTGAVAAGTSFVSVTAGGDANAIITLPAPVVGNIIWLAVGATGYELRTSAPGTIAINGGVSAAAESAIAASTLTRCICTSATTWICTNFGADGTVAATQVAAD